MVKVYTVSFISSFQVKILSGIVDLFEEGTALGKGVLEVKGSDIAGFCDDLVNDSNTYADIYQKSADQKVYKAIKKGYG